MNNSNSQRACNNEFVIDTNIFDKLYAEEDNPFIEKIKNLIAREKISLVVNRQIIAEIDRMPDKKRNFSMSLIKDLPIRICQETTFIFGLSKFGDKFGDDSAAVEHYGKKTNKKKKQDAWIAAFVAEDKSGQRILVTENKKDFEKFLVDRVFTYERFVEDIENKTQR